MPDAASVRQDDRKAGELVAERVIARGARRLVLLTPSQQWPAMIERQEGVLSVVKSRWKRRSLRGRDLRQRKTVADTQHDSPVRRSRGPSRRLLGRQRPDGHRGLDLGAGQTPVCSIRRARHRFQRLRVSEQYVRPRLTTVVSPAYEMGKRGAALLLKRFAQSDFDQKEILFDVESERGDRTQPRAAAATVVVRSGARPPPVQRCGSQRSRVLRLQAPLTAVSRLCGFINQRNRGEPRPNPEAASPPA